MAISGREVEFEGMNDLLASRAPELRQEIDEVRRWWAPDVPGQHIIYGDVLNPYLKKLLQAGGNDERRRELFTRAAHARKGRSKLSNSSPRPLPISGLQIPAGGLHIGNMKYSLRALFPIWRRRASQGGSQSCAPEALWPFTPAEPAPCRRTR